MKKIYRQYTDDQLMLSDNYGKHVSAMTGEALHSKSDIAAELAIRDDEIAELKAQLVEVNNNRTGVSPCAKFCEALAAKKMFDNLQQENAELKAQIELLRSAAENLLNADECEDVEDKATIHANMNDALLKTPAQCLAEVKAQAVEDFCASVEALALNQCPTLDECSENMVVGWKAGNVDCRMAGRKYANQLRQQAKAGD